MNLRAKHLGLDVFVIDDIFPLSLCDSLLKDIAAVPESAPNGMNKYGKPLFAAGPAWQAELIEMVDVFVQPLSVEKYGIRLKRQPYGFAVDYSPSTQKGLAKHFDSSDVTFNVCLGRELSEGVFAVSPQGVRIPVDEFLKAAEAMRETARTAQGPQ